MKTKSKNKSAKQNATGDAVTPMATAAALDGSAFSKVNASEAIPASWEERARKAWEYYVEVLSHSSIGVVGR